MFNNLGYATIPAWVFSSIQWYFSERCQPLTNLFLPLPQCHKLLSSHLGKTKSAENHSIVCFISLLSFASLGYTCRKLLDLEEKGKTTASGSYVVLKTVNRTVDKTNNFLSRHGKAETSEVSWPITATTTGLSLPSLHASRGARLEKQPS